MMQSKDTMDLPVRPKGLLEVIQFDGKNDNYMRQKKKLKNNRITGMRLN